MDWTLKESGLFLNVFLALAFLLATPACSARLWERIKGQWMLYMLARTMKRKRKAAEGLKKYYEIDLRGR